ncbi:hypothetical protein [Xenorhabdus sp. KJ12.1]|uniref:hypothetical protein n=1 Tax=Xenorhabdus sp. KJ12.1 TaxID=1851571 RepID=UPI000C045201|nr:hypothetical protein [Xenorhabdus sp. KJ12.1]PHM72254.1 hypothetical protein Xekj_00532 [Xenorhabdus sp. KJ12.1]
MLEQFLDGITFISSLIFSVILWGIGITTMLYSYFGRSDFFDLISKSVINTIFAIWMFIGSLPLLNYAADKEQYGSIVGRARELAMFADRPWYGVGGYQFLIVVLIAILGFCITYYKNRR